jgi:hypothetical protein
VDVGSLMMIQPLAVTEDDSTERIDEKLATTATGSGT